MKKVSFGGAVINTTFQINWEKAVPKIAAPLQLAQPAWNSMLSRDHRSSKKLS